MITGRWGQVDDVVNGIMFLARQDSSFVNGIVLPLDGGFLAGKPM